MLLKPLYFVVDIDTLNEVDELSTSSISAPSNHVASNLTSRKVACENSDRSELDKVTCTSICEISFNSSFCVSYHELHYSLFPYKINGKSI